MRKIFLVIFVLFATVAFAQVESEHMKFKGIPIDGTVDSFIGKMKAEGFKYLGKQDGIAMFEGDFAGYKNCNVGTMTLDGTNTVNTVVVLFPMCSDWASLERNYMSIKNMLTKKYGEPSDCIEEFQSLYGPYDDNERFYELGMGRCTYVTGFQTEKGSISVEMMKVNMLEATVKLQYWDRINTDAVRDNAMDDL